MSLFEDFDKQFDTKALAEDEKKAAENDFSNMPEVPDDTYTMKVDKMELKASKKGKPMVSIQFRITEGKYKNRVLFYNQVIEKGFGLHKANELLESMELDAVDYTKLKYGKLFVSFSQYGQMILDAYEEIDTNHLTYDINYETDSKGYHSFGVCSVNED